MKPRFRRFFKAACPALIVVPAMMRVAHAGTITSDASGKITVSAGMYADTILASGGTSATPTVDILNGATVHGDAVLLDAVDVSVAGYNINNAGTLDSTFGMGVDSRFVGNLWLRNYGTITSLEGLFAVNVGGIASIYNEGSISAFSGTAVNVIGTRSSVGNVSSSGISTITGGIDGVIAGADSWVSNYSADSGTSTITGGISGVIAGEGSWVTNFSYDSGISTVTGDIDGVIAGAGSRVYNFSYSSGTSTITGGTDGVIVGADSSVYNNGSRSSITGITGNGITAADHTVLPTIHNGIVNDGTITGGANGIFAGDFALVENTGTITGTGNIGVRGGMGSRVTNSSYSSGISTISGGTDGVSVGANSNVYDGDSSRIIGTTGNGITAAGNTVLPPVNNGIVNHGTITGGTNGIFTGDFVRVFNSGTITGTLNIGVRGGAGSAVSNSSEDFGATSTISGGTDGVIVGGGATVRNSSSSGTATIIGGTDGLIADAGSTVINSSSSGTSMIIGGVAGVIIGTGSWATNSSRYGGATTIIGSIDGVVIGAGSRAANFSDHSGSSAITGGTDGVIAGADSEVVNSSSSSGTSTITGGIDGVIAGAGSMVENSSSSGTSTITGGTDGVIVGAGSTVENSSSSSGTTTISGGADGVIAGAGSTVTNISYSGATATISGGTGGVIAGSGSTVTNYSYYGYYGTSTITGGTDGVIVGAGSTVRNSNYSYYGTSTISGGTTGVIAGAGSTVINDDGYEGTSTITGGIDGVIVGANSYAYNGIRARVAGATGNGLTAADNTVLPTIGNGIVNHGGIVGGINGIFAGDFARVFNGGILLNDGIILNGGTIIGRSHIGVRVGSNSVVDNYGWITGTVGISAFGDGGTFDLNNSGVITSTGGVAIAGLLSGVNTLRLNAGSVVNGDIHGGLNSDTLTFNGGQTSVDGASNMVHGDVTSMQDIIKNGTGTAFIGTPDDPLFTVETDAIHVTGGGLFLNGNVGGDQVAQTVINAGGTTLGGTGVWDAEVDLNAGDFSAGSISRDLTGFHAADAIGQVQLKGDLNVAAGSFIRFDVDTQATISNGVNSDLIVQTGVGNTTTFAPGAGLLFSPTDVNKVITDGTYIVIDSAESIQGTLPSLIHDSDVMIFSEFTTVGLADGGTDLVITVKHDFERLARTPNQAALGAAIDASVDSGDPLIQDFILAMDYSDLLTVQQTLADLTPETILGLADSIVNSNYRLHHQVQDRLAMTRSSGAMLTKTGKGNLWGAASYDWQDFEEEFGTDDFDREVGSFTAGVDYRVTDKLLLGLVLDGSSSHSDGVGFDTDIESLRGAIYGTWGGSTGLYVDALAGYGTHDIDSERELGRMGGILFGEASSSTDAESLQAMVTAGYAMGDERVKHGPFAGLEYQHVEVDGFTQESILPIGFDDFDIDSLRGLIGYRVDAKLSIFRPYASVAYAHEFGGDRANATAFFGDESFKVSGSERDSSILVTAGTGISLMNSLTLDLGYRGDLSMEDEGLTSHGATAGVNWIF